MAGKLDLLRKQQRVQIINAAEAAFDPLALGPIAWLDAPFLALADGTRVTTWTDKGTAGNSLSQTNALWKPEYKTNIQNGLAVLRFDGSTYHMTRASLAGGDLAQPGVIAVVGKMNAGVSALTKHMIDGNAATKRWAIGHLDNAVLGSSRWLMNAGSAVNNTVTDASWHVFLFRVNGASSALFVDGGAAKVTGDAGAHVLGGINVGANAGLVAVWGGDIGEVLIYGSMTVAQQNGLGKYLAGRWGLSWTNIS